MTFIFCGKLFALDLRSKYPRKLNTRGYWVLIIFDYAIQKRSTIWQYGVWSFQKEGTKLERFLHKNQHTQRKLLNFEFWINDELPKFDFQSQFSMSKIIGIFLIFEEYQFRSTFLVLDIF